MTRLPSAGCRGLVFALAAGFVLHSPAVRADAQEETSDSSSTLRPDQTADEWDQSRYTSERFEARVKLFGTFYDNYFRVPDDREPTTVRSTSLEGRLTVTLLRERRVKMYLQAIREDFQNSSILTSPTYSIGLRVDGERHGLDAAFRYLKDREQLDIGDLAAPSDIYIYYGAYSLRFAEDWEWAIEAERRDQRFPAGRRINDSELDSLSTSFRYRGWGRRFSPEIGYEARRRNAVDPHDDYDETMPWIRLRLSPFRALTASLRLRHREREYATGDPDDSNFGRVDRRDEWTLRADWLVGRRWALNVEAERLTADSTRESKRFTSGVLVLGTTIKVGPMHDAGSQRNPPAPPRPLTPPRAAPSPPSPADAAESASGAIPADTALSRPAPVAPSPPAQASNAPEARSASHSAAPVQAGESTPAGDSPATALETAKLLSIDQILTTTGPVFELRTSGELRLRSFSLREPYRFVVDLEGVVCHRQCGVRELGSGPVIRIRSAQLALAPRPVVRVVFDLRDAAVHGEIGRDGERIVVRFLAGER